MRLKLENYSASKAPLIGNGGAGKSMVFGFHTRGGVAGVGRAVCILTAA